MSAICPRFVQNAWKKDLCSNCFKSREEHQNAQAQQKRSIPVINPKAEPPKSIMKSNEKNGTPKRNVSFPRELSEVIGIGGDFSDIDDNDDYDNDYTDNGICFGGKSDDFEEQPDPELIRITKHNTDFNMNPSNLAINETKNESSIKKNLKSTFQALKLGVNNSKQPLQITVLPFGQKIASTTKVSDMKQKFTSTTTTTTTATSTTKLVVNMSCNDMMENDKPATPPALPEKSLLEEISETLEKNKKNETSINLMNESTNKSNPPPPPPPPAPPALENINKPNRSLTRHNPIIKKDQQKPKITIFTKSGNDDNTDISSSSSDGSTNSSDQESSTSAYYDVVTNDNFVNLDAEKVTTQNTESAANPSFFSSQLISDMFLSKKPISDHLRKRSEIYNLNDRSYITSKITSDGLIVTQKSNANSGLNYDEDDEDHDEQSSGSSFDTSSDEEMSSINNRSESDSGIGICVTTSSNEYQNVGSDDVLLKKSISSDYEEIQIEKTTSRELAGEPDGRSDPDGSAESVPALPKSPPPNIDARKSFLHGLQKSVADKPKLPAKPAVSVIKTFAKRATPASPNQVAQQQVILQLQQVITKTGAAAAKEDEKLCCSSPEENPKTFKKGRAPNPPTPPSTSPPSSAPSTPPATPVKTDVIILEKTVEFKQVNVAESQPKECELDAIATSPQPQISSLYQRNPNLSIKSNSPVVREKDKRERATTNPKFRSFNPSATQSTNRQSFPETLRSTTPEPIPRKSFSISQDSLNNLDIDKKKKTKFSIKKFLNIGNSNKNSNNSNNNAAIASAIQLQNKLDTIEHESQPAPIMFDSGFNIQNAKPRLVIIHPLDMNHSAVEVIKSSEIVTPTTTTATVQTPVMPSTMPSSIIGKPPAPPIRTTGMDGARIAGQEVIKPARPPPPKSAELRRKQKLAVSAAATTTIVSTTLDKKEPECGVKDGNIKPDNVYANLGEIRSSIAPRKPERTASMRGEKDTAYDTTTNRRRPIGQYENITPGSFNSDSGDNNSQHDDPNNMPTTIQLSRHPSDASDFSTSTDASASHTTETRVAVKLFTNSKHKMKEIGDKSDQSTLRSVTSVASSGSSSATLSSLNDGIKNSVQKMSTTIDSYLKDKKLNSFNNYAQQQQNNSSSSSSCNHDDVDIRSNHFVDTLQSARSSYQDQASPLSAINANGNVELYSKKFNQGNIPRATSMSYCGSEIGGGGGSICGESEIYSPYSYSASETGNDVAMGDPQEGWMAHGFGGNANVTKMRSGKIINRLRMRKGRSVVHKNLEDNYGAVIVANHEALAQVLEQLQQTPNVPMHLRPIANSINLRFDDFSLVEGARGMVVGRRAFHSAIWQANHIQVTLALTADCNQMSGVGSDLNQMSGGICGALNPITEFCDLVPSNYLPLMPSTQIRMIQTTISILPRMHIDTIQSLGTILKSRSNPNTSVMSLSSSAFGGSIPNLANIKEQHANNSNSSKMITLLRNGSSVQNLTTINDDTISAITGSVLTIGNSLNYDEILSREVGFVMLQLINGMKNLQAKGIEEMPLSLSNVILCREVDNKESQARLCVLQSLNQDLGRDDEETFGTLCQCANTAITTMLPNIKYTQLLSSILVQEKSDSLSKTKSILEYMIWGPSDVQLTGTQKERELALQRWLDLERATVLHGLVRTRIELTVYDECHLMFLVRSNAKIMSEASSILMAHE